MLADTSTSYVYVADVEGFCKVGVTNNLRKRRLQIQNGNPLIVRMYWAVLVPKDEAMTVEGRTHITLRDRGTEVGNEWFKVSCRTAINAVMDALLSLQITGVRGPGFLDQALFRDGRSKEAVAARTPTKIRRGNKYFPIMSV